MRRYRPYRAYGSYRSSVPCWYEEESKPCDCGVKPQVTMSQTGYSDSLYQELRCPQCGHVWCNYIEG